MPYNNTGPDKYFGRGNEGILRNSAEVQSGIDVDIFEELIIGDGVKTEWIFENKKSSKSIDVRFREYRADDEAYDELLKEPPQIHVTKSRIKVKFNEMDPPANTEKFIVYY